MNFDRANDQCEGLTPLHAAVQSGDPLLVAVAACCTLEVDTPDQAGWSPLCHALFFGQNEIARFLCAMGSEFEKATIDLVTLAMVRCERDLVAKAIAGCAVPEGDGVYRPISTAFATGRNAYVTELIVPEETKKFCRLYREFGGRDAQTKS
jgi:ankyrin repeat protein